jgi:hypothetical protein
MKATFLASAYLQDSGLPRERLSTGKRPSSPAPIYRKAAFLASAYLQEGGLPRQRLSSLYPASAYLQETCTPPQKIPIPSAYLRESGLPRQRLSTGKQPSSPAPIYRKAAFLASTYLQELAFLTSAYLQ